MISKPAHQPLAPPADMTRKEPHDELIGALRRGNEIALTHFYKSYMRLVHRTVHNIMGPDSEHDDIVQDTFFEAIRDISKFKGNRHQLPAWLRQIAVRRCRRRLQYRRVRSFLRFSAPESIPELPEHPSAHAHELLRRTMSLIEALAVDEQIAFTLRFVEQSSIPEITKVTGWSTSTTKRRVASARAAFDAKAKRDPFLCDWLSDREGRHG